mmetsp:Transcript_8191/g.17372  ORF Transcript_8191/g.17372 Transcript_8191/m.17372 type:complete len:204 (-) Transcript_8191:2615-3226(-)
MGPLHRTRLIRPPRLGHPTPRLIPVRRDVTPLDDLPLRLLHPLLPPVLQHPPGRVAHAPRHGGRHPRVHAGGLGLLLLVAPPGAEADFALLLGLLLVVQLEEHGLLQPALPLVRPLVEGDLDAGGGRLEGDPQVAEELALAPVPEGRPEILIRCFGYRGLRVGIPQACQPGLGDSQGVPGQLQVLLGLPWRLIQPRPLQHSTL